MALLRSSTGYDTSPIIRGKRVFLRAAQMADYVSWAELRALSREHLAPWEPLWSPDELSRTSFRRRVRHYQREANDDQGYAFLVFLAAHNRSIGRDPTVVGGATLTNVRRGVTQAATLGYWLGQPYVGQGLMYDALGAMLPFAFDILRLHRIEAAVMPSNVRSLRLLEHVGFQREGVARRYLKIRGRWEDHITHALLAEDFEKPAGLNA